MATVLQLAVEELYHTIQRQRSQEEEEGKDMKLSP
jgi:hypothetical protein